MIADDCLEAGYFCIAQLQGVRPLAGDLRTNLIVIKKADAPFIIG